MTEDQKDEIISACRHQDTSRPFLYFMVFLCLLSPSHNIDRGDVKNEVEKALDARGLTPLHPQKQKDQNHE